MSLLEICRRLHIDKIHPPRPPQKRKRTPALKPCFTSLLPTACNFLTFERTDCFTFGCEQPEGGKKLARKPTALRKL